MFFIESFLKIFYKKYRASTEYSQQEIELCNHLFYPIDSSGEYLACSKCGKLIKREEKS